MLTRIRIPFYSYFRLLFLLYLVLPQTQGARAIYEDYVHPFLEDYESHIDDFIATAHDRLKAEGLAYIRQAIEYVKTNILNMPPSPPAAVAAPEPSGTQSYSQALFARFSVPAARWSGSANAGADFYNFLAGAVAAASNATGGLGSGGKAGTGTGWDSIIPSNLVSPTEKMNFIAAQRDRLTFILKALDDEAKKVQRGEITAGHAHTNRASSMHYDGAEDEEPTQRPPSGMSSGGSTSGLSRNRSEADFETIDADSLTDEDSGVRRRNAPARGSWVPWIWGTSNSSGGEADVDPNAGASSGVEK